MLARHLRLHILVAIVALFLFNLEAKVTAVVGLPPTPQPNIVVIMTDDQDDRGSMSVMAKVNQLIKNEGITFTNSFTDFPLCCPSRATFLTGQASHNHTILGNDPGTDGGYGKFHPGAGNSLPVWLENSGYFTAHVGKYLNGYGIEVPQTTVPPGWSKWVGLVDPSTYSYYNFVINEDGVIKNYGGAESDYQTDVLANKITEIINSRAGNSQPFFIWFAPLAPHGLGDGQAIPVPAPRHQGNFSTITLPQPPSFNEADVSDKPSFVRENFPAFSSNDISTLTQRFHARRESLLAVDEAVEKIVNALRNSGKLDNTYIVFTSDNGFFHGEHRRVQGKNLVYEESIRVPLIVRGPNVRKGETRSQLVSNVDLPATILEISGATAGRTQDGLSLLPLLQSNSVPWRTGLLLQGRDGTFGRYKAIRTARYAYVEHALGSGPEKEFYDLGTDPYQLDSKPNDQSYASVVADLQSKLAALKNCSGASCWMLASEPLPPPPPPSDDSDNDGLLDSWEIAFFVNLNQNGSGDRDNDGLSNLDEFNYGTDPTMEDTDGDGYNDENEIQNNSDPWDPVDIPDGGGGRNNGGTPPPPPPSLTPPPPPPTDSSIFPGLVPCGFGGTPCTICHFWVLADRIIDFLTKWMALPILTVAILIGGLFILFAAGDSGKITQGKKIIASAVVGIFIAFGGWLIVNTVINTLGQGELTWSWNTISSCPAPLGGDGGGGGGGNQTDRFSCNNQGQCVSASNGQYRTSNCDNQCQPALRCSANQVSPLVNAIISCVTTAAAQAGVDVRTPTANQISQGQHTCDLNSNPPRISCHYGGQLCNGTGHAVDFSLATARNAQNWSRLLTIVQGCGTRGARCEMGQAPYIVKCQDPRVNHVHANTTQNCGCN